VGRPRGVCRSEASVGEELKEPLAQGERVRAGPWLADHQSDRARMGGQPRSQFDGDGLHALPPWLGAVGEDAVVDLAEQAIDQYKQVLERDPKNINSVKGIAYLYLQIQKFDDAKTYYRKAIEVDPNDPEPYYSVAVIDWTQSYQPRMEERAKAGLKPDEWIMKDKGNKKICEMLREKNTGVIEDGIAMLQKALQLRPDYDDAMAYLNLMYRERGDLQCDDAGARAADLKTADEWVDKTLATKKAKAEKQPGAQGITMPSQ